MFSLILDEYFCEQCSSVTTEMRLTMRFIVSLSQSFDSFCSLYRYRCGEDTERWRMLVELHSVIEVVRLLETRNWTEEKRILQVAMARPKGSALATFVWG